MATHNIVGSWGENIAQIYLLKHGYHIQQCNWTYKHLEIDIIAEKLGILVFVEVKTRSQESYAPPEEAVDQDKIRNLIQAANDYVGFYHLDFPCQFDVISVIGSPESYKIRHTQNAFDGYNWNDFPEFYGRFWKQTTFEGPQ